MLLRSLFTYLSGKPQDYHRLPVITDPLYDEEKAGNAQRSCAGNLLRQFFLLFDLNSHGSIDARSPCSSEESSSSSTTWLDGLRGMSSFVVFIEHFSLPYQSGMLVAFGSPGADSFWQLPIIRLLYSGTPMVSIFFVVSGCALSLKILTHAHKGTHDDALRSLSSSVFRRGIRLFAPTTIATFCVVLLTQLRLYEYQYPHLEIHGVPHMVLDRPPRLPSFTAQLLDWMTYLMTKLYYPETWMLLGAHSTTSIYASQLWTIPVEFYSSMALYVLLGGLVQVKQTLRLASLILLAIFTLYVGRWDIMLFCAGAVIAENIVRVQLERKNEDGIGAEFEYASIRPAIWHIMQLGLLLIALLLLSYPDHAAEINYLYHYPASMANDKRIWQSLGAVLLLYACSITPLLQSVFCFVPMRYLGRISFGLYIVHIPILASYGWALVPWVWSKATGHVTWLTRSFGFILALAIMSCIVIVIAAVWTKYVDEPLQDIAKKFERWACVKSYKRSTSV